MVSPDAQRRKAPGGGKTPMTTTERVLKAFEDASNQVFRASRECSSEGELLRKAEKARQRLVEELDKTWEAFRHNEPPSPAGNLDDVDNQLA